MYHLKTSATFDSAHFLSGYQGKCANLHGHTWRIDVEIASEQLEWEGEKRGMLLDFNDLKKIVKNLADSFDHTLIYEENTLQNTTVEALSAEGFHLTTVPFRPTAECFAKHFYTNLKDSGLPIYRITVYETPNNCATYRKEN
ncbi:MAG: 6-carboxytetrahydropterin synthase QueD [Ruminococcus sp.]|nr:6-carboxytetrahydropterin synthase QueD [Ruminococcus sp.]